jgi:hypothetical protein
MGLNPIPGRIVRILALEVDVGDPAWYRDLTKVQLSQSSINTYFRACCVTSPGWGEGSTIIPSHGRSVSETDA